MPSIIQNRKELSSTFLRTHALDILEQGIHSVLPANIMSSIHYDADTQVLSTQGKEYTLTGRIFVIGAGKASSAMAQELENIIGAENITDGVILCKTTENTLKKIRLIETGHPFPSQSSLQGTKSLMELKHTYKINPVDTIICLLSGGGSSMLSLPVQDISLTDQQKLTDLLIHSGASIQEINTIRKHLSQVKGGLLSKYFQPTTLISLVLSDVINDDISTIASGPTIADPSTFSDVHTILMKYALLSDVPENIVKHINNGISGQVKETPKILYNCHYHIIGNNTQAISAMKRKADQLGYRSIILAPAQEGDPDIIAVQKLHQIRELQKEGYTAFLMGAEMSPRIPREHGTGGRNQHYVARNLLEMQTMPNLWIMASMNSDGHDFIENTAGAIIDDTSILQAKDMKLSVKTYLDTYDSHSLLKKLGDSLIRTAPTNTNVCDLILYIVQ